MAYAKSSVGYEPEGYIGQEAQVQRSPNNLQAAAETFESAKSLSLRIQAYVSRLCGEVPEAANRTQGITGAGGGLFSALGQSSREASSYIRDAHDALDRLEKELA